MAARATSGIATIVEAFRTRGSRATRRGAAGGRAHGLRALSDGACLTPRERSRGGGSCPLSTPTTTRSSASCRASSGASGSTSASSCRARTSFLDAASNSTSGCRARSGGGPRDHPRQPGDDSAGVPRRAEAGPIGELPPRGRFRWLVSPRSTMIQMSPVHTGRTSDPAACLERLLDKVVRRPA